MGDTGQIKKREFMYMNERISIIIFIFFSADLVSRNCSMVFIIKERGYCHSRDNLLDTFCLYFGLF